MAETGDGTKSAGSALLKRAIEKQSKDQELEVYDEALKYNRENRPGDRIVAEEAAQEERRKRSSQPS